MSKVRPGTPFEVEYGDGLKATVQVLSLPKQQLLASVVRKMQEAEKSQDGLVLFDLCRDALDIAMVEVTDEFLETIDGEDALSIAVATLNKTGLNDDEEKKSESPHSLDAANSASTANGSVEKTTPAATR